MSNADEGDSPRRPKKGPLLPLSRILLLVFVVLAAVVIVQELRVRHAFNSSYEAVDGAIVAGDSSGEGFYKKDVDALLRGSPLREPDQASAEVFTWGGLLQKYRMRLQYAEDGFVEKIEQL